MKRRRRKSVIIAFLLIIISVAFAACNVSKYGSDGAGSTGMVDGSGVTLSSTDKNILAVSTSSKEAKPTANAKTPSNTDETTRSDNIGRKDKADTESIGNDSGVNDKIFTITFKDYDGEVLATEEVKQGDSATAPFRPKRDGYKFVKWNTTFDNVLTDTTVTAIYDEITLPTIFVEDADCDAGDTVTVRVSVLNDPGVLGMLANITYDESVMTLRKADNGSAFSDYVFTAPKNTQSGCNAAWYINDVPNKITDGEILTLQFDVSKTAPAGSYPISVTCRTDAFDSDYNEIPFDFVSGVLNIK